MDIVTKSSFEHFPESAALTEPNVSCSFPINPEEKRKVIGKHFLAIANEAMRELKLDLNDVFLVLPSDLLEIACKLVSESDHNDMNLVQQLCATNRAIEPLKEFHECEVRTLGRDLGLPDTLVDRLPSENENYCRFITN